MQVRFCLIHLCNSRRRSRVFIPPASAARSTRRDFDVTALRNARLRLESALPKHSLEQKREVGTGLIHRDPHSSQTRSNIRFSDIRFSDNGLSMPSLRSSSFGVAVLHAWQQGIEAESTPNQTGPWQIAQGRRFLYSSSDLGLLRAQLGQFVGIFADRSNGS